MYSVEHHVGRLVVFFPPSPLVFPTSHGTRVCGKTWTSVLKAAFVDLHLQRRSLLHTGISGPSCSGTPQSRAAIQLASRLIAITTVCLV